MYGTINFCFHSLIKFSMKKFIILLFYFCFFFSFGKVKSVEIDELLIPGEKVFSLFKKRAELNNFKDSGLTPLEWRQRKCQNKAIAIFQRSPICPYDQSTCSNDYIVGEIQNTQYKKNLKRIALVCADGYELEEADRKKVDGDSDKDIDELISFLRSKKKKDYSNLKIADERKKEISPKNDLTVDEEESEPDPELENQIKLPIQKKVPLKTEFEEKSPQEKLREIEQEEKELLIRSERMLEIIQAEKEILEKKRKLVELELSFDKSEKAVEEQKKVLKSRDYASFPEITEPKKKTKEKTIKSKKNIKKEIENQKVKKNDSPPKSVSKQQKKKNSTFKPPNLPGVPVIPIIGGGFNLDELLGKQSQVVRTMTSALLNLTKAQSKFLEALGEKEAAIASRMYVDALKKGEAIGKDDLEKALIQSKKSQEIINKKILESKLLDANAKLIFAKGLPPYGKGVAGLVSTGFQAQQIVSSMTSNLNPLIITKIGSLLFIAKNTPSAISLFSKSTGTMMDFASTNKIDTKPLEEAKTAMGD